MAGWTGGEIVECSGCKGGLHSHCLFCTQDVVVSDKRHKKLTDGCAQRRNVGICTTTDRDLRRRRRLRQAGKRETEEAF